MRLSVEPEDGESGFLRNLRLHGVNLNYVKVTLDGVDAESVTMADEEAGEIRRYVVDANGKFVLTVTREIAEETVHGTVRLVPIETPSGDWPHAIPRPTLQPPPIDFTLMRF